MTVGVSKKTASRIAPPNKAGGTVGRKLKLTPETRKKLLDAIRLGSYFDDAAIYAGIHEATFYRWMSEGERAESGPFREFYDSVKAAESEASLRDLACITKAADAGNWQAAAWKRERRKPEKWGRVDRSKVELDAKIEHSADADELEKLLDKLAERMKSKGDAGDE